MAVPDLSRKERRRLAKKSRKEAKRLAKLRRKQSKRKGKRKGKGEDRSFVDTGFSFGGDDRQKGYAPLGTGYAPLGTGYAPLGKGFVDGSTSSGKAPSGSFVDGYTS